MATCFLIIAISWTLQFTVSEQAGQITGLILVFAAIVFFRFWLARRSRETAELISRTQPELDQFGNELPIGKKWYEQPAVVNGRIQPGDPRWERFQRQRIIRVVAAITLMLILTLASYFSGIPELRRYSGMVVIVGLFAFLWADQRMMKREILRIVRDDNGRTDSAR